MYQYNLLFEARSIGEFFKRLGILILTVILLSLYVIGVTYVIESFIKNFNYNYLLITMKILENTVCSLIPAIILLMIPCRIINNISRRYLVYREKIKDVL
ncbi:hypothetical protein [Clostridium sartagoforme]|jgi:hypothetical protein|uniref:hypothetical protein n=1 Tax=Clostridium sartagoforme TaxID=84031 RepID=UPI0031D30541